MKGIDIHFRHKSDFYRELCARVSAYFEESGLPRRNLPAMYFKTAIILAWLALSYVLLVFFATTWWQVVILSVSLTLSIVGVGFNIHHDATHGAYSNKRLVNRVAGLSLDLIGGSSYLWRWRHNVMHHNYPNIDSIDDDINVGGFARMSPEQTYHRTYRFQHLYLWLLYGFVSFRWQLVYDFKEIIQSRIGDIDIPRAGTREIVLFVAGKFVFLSLGLVVPMLLHPVGIVVLVYFGIMFAVGLIVAVVFQLAHCVQEAEFPSRPAPGEPMQTDWAQHQLSTTVDFSRNNRLLTWYLGGLNFQVVHHLFPTVCHLHYPALSQIVESTCKQFDVPYRVQPSMGAAIASHYRWIREMGKAGRSASAPA